jgi:hypothetical protein
MVRTQGDRQPQATCLTNEPQGREREGHEGRHESSGRRCPRFGDREVRLINGGVSLGRSI